MLVATPQSRFDLGRVSVSKAASEKLYRDMDIDPALALHAKGYWGDQEPSQWRANDSALAKGGRLRSVFHSNRGVEFVVITEQDSGRTLVILPSEE